MDRELVLACLALALMGPALHLGALWPRRTVALTSTSRQAERRCWLSVWAPVAPALAVFCALLGWAALEPADAEVVPRSIAILTAPFGFAASRAVWRALKSLFRRPGVRAAATIGFWRPRILVSQGFRAALDQRALMAALAHEAAHVRHRDPLRMWLAQFATDLQWPSPRATERFRIWCRVLEFARDDEARQAGIEGEDLAAAILQAARLHQGDGVVPALVGEALDLEARIRRLLAPHASEQTDRQSHLLLLLAAVPALVAVTLFGALVGETVVRTVFAALP